MKYGPSGRAPSRKITVATMTFDSTGTSISVLSLGSKSFRDVAHRAVWIILCDTQAVDSKSSTANKLSTFLALAPAHCRCLRTR